jgi:superfamily II DNA/RNA helicase
MLPIIMHIKNQHVYQDKKGPIALILTPHLVTKDNIHAVTKEYLDAAEISCTSIYENDEKETQIELLKKSNYPILT